MQELLITVTEALEDARMGRLSENRTIDVLALAKAHLEGVVKRAVATLSYSELVAMSAVVDYLKGESGKFVGSAIVKGTDINRSVLVTGQSKLEAAGVFKCHSLGASGTIIQTLITGWGALVKDRLAA